MARGSNLSCTPFSQLTLPYGGPHAPNERTSTMLRYISSFIAPYLHGHVHSLLDQIGMCNRHLCQGRLAGVFDGEAIVFSLRNSPGNFHDHAPDVTNFACHAGENHIQLAAKPRQPFLMKPSDEILPRKQASDENPLFSALRIKPILFHVRPFAVGVARLYWHDVEFI